MNGMNAMDDLMGRAGYPYFDIQGRQGGGYGPDAFGQWPQNFNCTPEGGWPTQFQMTPQGAQMGPMGPMGPMLPPGPPAPPAAMAGYGGGYGYDQFGQCGPIGGGCGPCPVPVNPFVFGGWPVLGCPPYATWPGAGMGAGPGFAGGFGPGFGAGALVPPNVMGGQLGPQAQMGGGGWGGGWGDPLGCFGPPATPLLVQNMQQPFALLKPRCPRELRLQLGGFGCVCIPGCEEVTLECTAPELMKIIDITIPSDVANDLVITDISAGTECLLLCDAAPAAMLSENADLRHRIAERTLDSGETFSISLFNKSKHDVEACVGFVAWVLVK